MRSMNDGFPAVETMSAPEARAVIVGRRLPVDNLDDVAGDDDQLIPGPGGDIPVRIYRPHGHSETRPAVVFCHGGFFVLCNVESHRRVLPGDGAPHRVGGGVGGLPARAGTPSTGSCSGRLRHVLLADRARVRARRGPCAGADCGGQRGREPCCGHRVAVPRGRRGNARRSSAHLSRHRPDIRHFQLPGVRQRVREHPCGDAVVLGAVSRWVVAALTGVSGDAGTRYLT